jgi:hypothetical protein
MGFDMAESKTSRSDIEKNAQPLVLARTSWVNFMQAIGISPDNETLFEMQFESALLNGMVPMRWRGPDLVGLCSMLGFQTSEQKPEFHTAMRLPIQWNGPLGYLQFRAGFEGCVVEFRRRAVLGDELPLKFHKYYKNREPFADSTLVSRLCYALGGFSVEKDGKRELFFIGSCDYESTLEMLLAGLEKRKDGDNGQDEEGKKTDQEEEGKEKDKAERRDSFDSMDDDMDDIFKELEIKSLDDDEILEKVWGVPMDESRRRRGLGPKKGEIRSELVKNVAEENRKKKRKEKGLVDVIKTSPGLLSIAIQSEMACSRGLDLTNCLEYDRAFVLEDMVDDATYPHRLGNMAMSLETLKLFKDAMLALKPDGFYFSPTGTLSADVNDVYRHVKSKVAKLARITPETAQAEWKGFDELYWASEMCNSIHLIPRKARIVLSVADMGLMAKACASLHEFIKPTGQDLVWAMLVCPKLFSRVSASVGKMSATEIKTTLKKTVNIKNENLDCTALMGPDVVGSEKAFVGTTTAERGDKGADSDESDDENEDENSHIFAVPLCSDGEFSTAQLVAAFVNVCLTFYWLERKWVSDVSMYSAAIPPTVMMF